MFAKNSAGSIQEYIGNVPEDRQSGIKFLHKFIQKTAPSLKPYFALNMLGYSSFTYLSARQLLEWPIVALTNQKIVKGGASI